MGSCTPHTRFRCFSANSGALPRIAPRRPAPNRTPLRHNAAIGNRVRHHPPVEHPETPEPAELGDLYRSLLALTLLLASRRHHVQLRAEVDIDLDRASLAVLRVLEREPGPVRVGRLAGLLRVQAPHVTREVRNLAARGLVEVTTEAGDRRARLATLTEDGREVLARFDAILRERLARAVQDVSREDLRTTAAVLDRVVAGFRDP